MSERLIILQNALMRVRHDPSVSSMLYGEVGTIANLTNGFSANDLRRIVTVAARTRNSNPLRLGDLTIAHSTVINERNRHQGNR